jgi:hypothetical protein
MIWRLPRSLNILGKTVKIVYCEKVSEVDAEGKDPLWGQYLSWESTIRVFAGQRSQADILHTIIHEVVHAILMDTHIKGFESHEDLDLFAGIMADTLLRNNLIRLEDS